MSRTRWALLACIAVPVLATSAYALARPTPRKLGSVCGGAQGGVVRLSGTLQPTAIGQAYLVYPDGAFVSSAVRGDRYDFTVAKPQSPGAVPMRIEYSTAGGRRRSTPVVRSDVLGCLALRRGATMTLRQAAQHAVVEQLARRLALRAGAGAGYGEDRAVLYTVSEQRDPRQHIRREQRWRTSTPEQERAVSHQHGQRFESAIWPGGTWTDWSSERPDAIEQTPDRGILRFPAATMLRAAYDAGQMRVLSHMTVNGRAAYRVEQRGSAGPEIVSFYAHTFAPIEIVDCGFGAHKELVPTGFRVRYLTYEELPPTAANLALLRMAPHPGAFVVDRSRP